MEHAAFVERTPFYFRTLGIVKTRFYGTMTTLSKKGTNVQPIVLRRGILYEYF